ncbi:MAG: DUF1566 domain-containing protein, partial [Magnetococcus sp. WYHC-3]
MSGGGDIRTQRSASTVVGFTSATQNLTEGRHATLVVSLSGFAPQAVSVPFTLGGAALNGTDYTLMTPSPLAIPAGGGSVGLQVRILEDAVNESDESLTITLGTPTNATLGSIPAHVVTLKDAATLAAAPSFRTGQSVSMVTGDDAQKASGQPWPAQRLIDNGDGTVSDALTGLIWLAEADCLGRLSWQNGINAISTLANGQCGLIDGSAPGAWRLPNRRELRSLVDHGRANPALPGGGAPFLGVTAESYWTSSTYADLPDQAWRVHMGEGDLLASSKEMAFAVWPVRGGVVNFTVEVKEWQERILFLHTIARGAADRSYGIHVAELA